MKNKNIIIYISVTVFFIILFLCITLFMKFYKNEKDIDKEAGTVTIELIDKQNISTTKQLDFTIDDTLVSILENNYRTVWKKDPMFGPTLYEIENIVTDFFKDYIALYVDDNYSHVSIPTLVLKDNMKISLRYTKI
ncbi:MAG: hypothetical protein ACRC5M_06595 [Anaeroplasmataceae bacterium]